MADHAHDEHHVHPPSFYIRTWGVLMVLLVISGVGPLAEIWWLTLITAFGVAVVKAYLVITRFMHLDNEKPVVHYFLVTSLVFMFLMFAGISPDVLNHEGTNWENLAAKNHVEAEMAAAAEAEKHGGGHGHGGDHGDGHGDGH